MSRVLSKIELLDQQFPGFTDQLRRWMSEGISCRQIVELVFDRYQIRISPSPIERFRARRWAREQDRLQNKLVQAHAAQELQREREIRSALDEILGDLQ